MNLSFTPCLGSMRSSVEPRILYDSGILRLIRERSETIRRNPILPTIVFIHPCISVVVKHSLLVERLSRNYSRYLISTLRSNFIIHVGGVDFRGNRFFDVDVLFIPVSLLFTLIS